MPLQATSGAASYDAFGGGVPVVPNYIEDVFSTYLYTGTGASQTITNGIDLSGKGGLVWTKNRTVAYSSNLYDTARGAGYYLNSNTTAASANGGSGVMSSFNSNGFTLGEFDNSNYTGLGVSWTFRKQPKFFDVVTYSGDVPYPGAGVSHNLGSVPGCIICKRTDSTSAWGVWHRANSVSASVTGLSLNTTGSALYTNQNFSSAMTSTSFAPALVNDASGNAMNTAGATYVAYIFAHNAGGFGLTGTDNVISCGSYTGNNSTNNITLGYEPQFVLIKAASGTYASGTPWLMMDTMRGLPGTVTNAQQLRANTSGAESSEADSRVTATGFQVSGGFNNTNNADNTYIYIAIRRGPMKVPTSGTSVFKPVARAGDSLFSTVTTGFAPDMVFGLNRTYGGAPPFIDKLRGVDKFLVSSGSTAEQTDATIVTSFNNDGLSLGQDTNGNGFNNSGRNFVFYPTKRAPSFFDEVCYTGDGTSGRQITHNLTVAPELMIVRARNGSQGSTSFGWRVYAAPLGPTKYIALESTGAAYGPYSDWNLTTPTSTVFSVYDSNEGVNTTNYSAINYVAYLFATCAGVSKVGGYTGTGTTLQIDCGFTAGARFVLIKRADASGAWYVWDTARGIVAGNDPYLLLNSTAAEVTNTDYIDTYSAGFEISSTAPAAINASGGTFIFLAIA